MLIQERLIDRNELLSDLLEDLLLERGVLVLLNILELRFSYHILLSIGKKLSVQVLEQIGFGEINLVQVLAVECLL